MLRIEQLKEQGNLLFNQKNYQAALEKYDAILAMDRRHEAAWLNKALTYKRLKDFDTALIMLEQLLTINPRHPKGLYQKAWILQQQGNYTQAKIFYNKVLELKPEDVDANIALFQCKQQSNAKMILAVADLKLTPDNQVKILEFGNYIHSSCSGYENLTGKKILDIYKETNLPPLFLALSPDGKKFDYSKDVHLGVQFTGSTNITSF